MLCRYIDYEKLYTQLLLQSTSLQPSSSTTTAVHTFPSSGSGADSGGNDSSREMERLVKVVGTQADEIDLLK